MKFLVTGGAGFIGSAFVKYLLQNNESVIVLDSLTYAGNFDNLSSHLNEKNIIIPKQHKRLELVKYSADDNNLNEDSDPSIEQQRLDSKLLNRKVNYVDIKNIQAETSNRCLDEQLVFVYGNIVDPDIVDSLVAQCDIVVHFAAETHVDRSILNPDEFVKTDVYGTYVLLEAARKSGNLKKFIHISTDEVYGAAIENSFTELDPINPRNPYSASKAAADRLVYAYNQTYGLNINIIRPSNNFGPYQYPEKLIPVMIIKALRDEPLPVYGDGNQVRDWLFVDNTVRAIDYIIKNGNPGETYNVAGGNEKRNIEIVRFILNKLDKPKTLIRYVEDRPGHDIRYSLDDTKLTNLGFRHTGLFEEQLSKTIQWYDENRGWWESILKNDKDYQEFVQKWYKDRQ